MTARPTIAIAEELLSESAAVARIPGRDAMVRAWLRGLGIARRGPTCAVYRWSEIVAALEPIDAPAPPPVAHATRGARPRVRL
ncbi:MAG: hypothetical protein RL139_668 [Gemmatimonadota bacterium]